MHTGDALLQAICDDPEADDLRHIYADWLDDHGEPERAEFIRLELSLAGWDHDSSPEQEAEYRRLDSRWKHLVARHSDDWHAALLPLVEEFTTTRGFVTRVATSASRFAHHAAELFALAPLLTSLQLDRVGRFAKAVSRQPELRRLQQLAFHETTLGSAGLQAILQADLPQLTHLSVTKSRIDGFAMSALSRCPTWQRLESLDLSFNPLAPADGQYLATTCAPPGLRELHLYDCQVGDLTAVAIARAIDGPHLRVLNLGSNSITALGVEALAASPRLMELEELELFACPIGTGLLALANSPYLGRLRRLVFGLSDNDEETLVTFLHSALAAGLDDLALGGGEEFAADACAALVETCQNLRRLASYDLASSSIPILAGATLPRLVTLDLSCSQFARENLRGLLGGPLLTSVYRLHLSDCGLGNDGASILAAAPVTARFRVLNLSNNAIGPLGGRALAESPYLDGLDELVLTGNPLGDAEAILRARFGDRLVT